MSLMPRFKSFVPRVRYDHLSEEQRNTVAAILAKIKEIQAWLHSYWRKFSEEEVKSIRVRYIAKQIWVIEWCFSQLGLMKEVAYTMPGLDVTEEQILRRKLLSNFAQLKIEFPSDQPLGYVKFFVLLGFSNLRFEEMNLQEVLEMLNNLKKRINRKVEKAWYKRTTLQQEIEFCPPEVSTLVDRPIEESNDITDQNLRITRVHNRVSHIRICVRRYQKPEEKSIMSATEMIPAWGEAAEFWKARAWKRICPETMDMVRKQSFEEDAFTANADTTILDWNVRRAGNMNFVPITIGLLEKHAPAIAIFTETRIPIEKAPFFLDQIPLGRWEATETSGFKGGMWLAWDPSRAKVEVLSKTSQELHALVEIHAAEASSSAPPSKRLCIGKENISS